MSKRTILAALIAVLALAPAADAALMAYLKLAGTKSGVVKGGVTQKGREDSIGVIAVDHQVSGGDGITKHGRFVVTKELDRSSPILYAMLASSETAASFELKFWTPQVRAAMGVGAEAQHFTIRLTNARIVDVKFKMPNVRNPEQAKLAEYEEVSFTYSKIEWVWNDGGIAAEDTVKPDR
jgi:type VI secretion system secreted protein Hcp